MHSKRDYLLKTEHLTMETRNPPLSVCPSEMKTCVKPYTKVTGQKSQELTNPIATVATSFQIQTGQFLTPGYQVK